jgi:hypothetical protein
MPFYNWSSFSFPVSPPSKNYNDKKRKVDVRPIHLGSNLDVGSYYFFKIIVRASSIAFHFKKIIIIPCKYPSGVIKMFRSA